MGRARRDRCGHQSSHEPASRRYLAMRPVPTSARCCPGFFRPRLEILEDRLYPGDTVLGFLALAVWGRGLASAAPPFDAQSANLARDWGPGLSSTVGAADPLSAIFLPEDSPSKGQCELTVGGSAATDRSPVSASVSDSPFLADDPLARQVAGHREGAQAFPMPERSPEGFFGTAAGLGAPWSGVSESFFASAGRGDGGRSPGLLAASRGGSAPLSFDSSTGQLAIREDVGEHTVRESLATDGFVDVTLDGQGHSSNPSATSFDSALAGATAATVAGIGFDGAGQDTLILGSQHLAGGFTVQAAGATVVTESVVTAGPLAIQAPNITVSGALQGSTVSLAAPEWVNIDAAGRIDAVPSAGRSGTIAVAASVFVNSGQLHADGPTGGQIVVQAGKVLNAGPITADGAGLGGSRGQVHIAFTDSYVATTAAVMSASSASGPGGHLTIDGGSTGHLFSSGRHLATGSLGGTVDLFGRDVVLAGAVVDASGEAGGGSVRIGGDFHGRNPAVVNAQTVTVTPASTIRADAQQSGRGGQVSVWSNQTTAFDGTVSTRGGQSGGSGGFIEVSGHGDLSYGGSVDAGARLGKSGTLLLDPKNIIISDAPDGVFPQFDLIDPHPTAGGVFGSQVSVLSNGNVAVTNPNDNFGGSKAGAVYLFDGLNGGLISSLVGSQPNDQVGYGYKNPSGYGFNPSITLLNNGNYLVGSPYWNGQRGAATWGNGSAGVSGTVSIANSLVGSNPGDYVGFVTPLSNGNYVVSGGGAVTWGNGSTGVSGTVSEANSLVGAAGFVIPLTNGNYVVSGGGAVTWGNGTTGVSGVVSAANSLVSGVSNYVTALTNGNYVVASPDWGGGGLNPPAGAVTWGNGDTGVRGTIPVATTLVGATYNVTRFTTRGEHLGSGGVIALSNGNFLILSPDTGSHLIWWGNGSTGRSFNSFFGFVTPLSNGNFVVANPIGSGAVTWVDGRTGIGGGSLVGSNPDDAVGGYYTRTPDRPGHPPQTTYYGDVTPLSNGNYVVGSRYWNSGRGAVTWGNGKRGTSGIVSAANSLVGSNPFDDPSYNNGGDQVGGAYPLSNGNYVVRSPNWNGIAGP
jgi:hypothetical protein